MGTVGEPLRYYPDRAFYLAPHAEILKAYLSGLIQDPLHFLHQRLAAVWALWGAWTPTTAVGRSLVASLLIGLRFPLVIAGLWGCVRLRRGPFRFAVLGAVVGLTLLHMALYATSRYSYPLEPALMIAAAAGLAMRRTPANADSAPDPT
jgi:hypothetical protein